MENVSVWHWVVSATSTPPGLNAPANINPTETELVEGPVMTKLLKSSRIWQMLSLQGQILALQLPVATDVDESK